MEIIKLGSDSPDPETVKAAARMRPEDVLYVFQDWQRFAKAYGAHEDCEEPLSFDSSLDLWQRSCDLKSGRSLGRYLNKVFLLDADDKQWQIIFRDGARLRLLCEFVAEQTRLRGLSDGAIAFIAPSVSHERMFKNLSHRLRQDGVPLEGALPSTPIEPYTVQHFDSFVAVINELAPGSLARPDLRWKTVDPFSITLAFCLIYLFYQVIYRYSAAPWGSALFTCILCFFGIKFWDKYHASACFRDLDTLGDLTRLMVMHSRQSIGS